MSFKISIGQLLSFKIGIGQHLSFKIGIGQHLSIKVGPKFTNSTEFPGTLRMLVY